MILFVNILAFLVYVLIGYLTKGNKHVLYIYLLAFVVSFYNIIYYIHYIDNSPTYYLTRSWWIIDYIVSLSGLYVGYTINLKKISGILCSIILGFVSIIGIVGPGAKYLINPLDIESLIETRKGDVVIQSTIGTCGPCALASILIRHGVKATERELASEAYTCASGTESWYLRRCAIKRGFFAEYKFNSNEMEKDSIIGIKLLGGAGHFISIIDIDAEYVYIADSMSGKRKISKTDIFGKYQYSGLYLKIWKAT